ncbi:MAG TPA: T9SS type A sorting domain-containing protein [Flavipsychrobacter sp.]|nr:T9SS type A sorting domain-containing protein [Flavipsychrobacter sp.]
MYRAFAFLLAFFITVVSFAQNIVQNPGFELYSQCPPFLDNLAFCNGWKKPTSATTDYFNSCDSIYVGVPGNHCGYQQASGGNAYAGFMTYEGNWPDYREYLMGHLLNMVAGQYYKVSIKVSLAGNYAYATDGISILLTVDSFYIGNVAVLPQSPQIDFSDYGPVTDTTNWVTLTDTFYADSAYNLITIGCFKEDNLLDMDTVYGQWPEAYYFIDDVEIVPVTLGVAEHEKEKNAPVIYPHPVATSATMTFSNRDKEPFTFRLYDVQGREVMYITDIRTDHIIIDRSALSSGIFFYRLGSDRIRYVGKLMVE